MNKKTFDREWCDIIAIQRTIKNDGDFASFLKEYGSAAAQVIYADIPIGHWLISPGDDLPLEVVSDIEKRFPEEHFYEYREPIYRNFVKKGNIIRAVKRTGENDADVAGFREAFDEIGYPDGLSPNAYGLDIPIGHWLISPGDDLPLEVVSDLEKRFPEEDYREIVDNNPKTFVKKGNIIRAVKRTGEDDWNFQGSLDSFRKCRKCNKSNSAAAPVTYADIPIYHWLIVPDDDDLPLEVVSDIEKRFPEEHYRELVFNRRHFRYWLFRKQSMTYGFSREV